MKSRINVSAHSSLRNLPRNFLESDRHIFESELEKEIPATEIVELADVKITSEGLLFKNGKLTLYSFAFPENLKRWKWRSLIKAHVKALLLSPKRTFSQTVVWATDDWSAGYFHWLCDVLPRLYVADEVLAETALLLPHELHSLEFVRDSLSMFGVRNVEYIRKGEIAHCSRIVLPKHTARSGDFSKPIIKSVRERMLGSVPREARSRSDRVYISRGSARKRRIVNEDSVIGVLGEYGFRIIRAEDLSFRDQVEAFSGAQYFVSNHGAGMTNMLFAKDGATVLELRHRSDSINNCYFNMASALDLEYLYQLCDSDSDDPHVADLFVDLDDLRRNLDLMLTDQ